MLTDAEKEALEKAKAARYNAIAAAMPQDAYVGVIVESSSKAVVSSPWITKLTQKAELLSTNARVYANYSPSKTDTSRKKNYVSKKIVSPEGFPPDVTVSYVSPPPFSYKQWYGTAGGRSADRPVKYFILHSFGHDYEKKMLAKKREVQISVPPGVTKVDYLGKQVYVTSSTDPVTLQNFDKFLGGLMYTIRPSSGATAHFFIDRVGNLVVVGDCQDIMYTSNSFNDEQIGVEMEEAFFILTEPTKKNPRTIKYFSWGPKQVLTLSILIAKMEIVYPDLMARNVYFEQNSVTWTKSSKPAPGYLMHDSIANQNKDPRMHHSDVAPGFKEKRFWDELFKLVDLQKKGLSGTLSVFKGKQEYPVSASQRNAGPPVFSGAAGGAVTAAAQAQGQGQDRADALVNSSKSSTNSTASNAANSQAQAISEQAAHTQSALVNATPSNIDLPSMDVELGEDGTQYGTTDAY